MNVVITYKSGNNEVLKASLSSWANHLPEAEITVIGDKCTLPKDVNFIPCDLNVNDFPLFIAEKLDCDKFIFAHNTYPFRDIKLSDIDKFYIDNGKLFTGLPRLYVREKVINLKYYNPELHFEHNYFSVYNKKNKRTVLHDLSDTIRLKLFNPVLNYREKHLLKYKTFLVVNEVGQKALNNFLH